MATRLAYFWGVQSVASAFSGLMASGLLQLRGLGGLEGWKWMFIVDGIITIAVAIFTWYALSNYVVGRFSCFASGSIFPEISYKRGLVLAGAKLG